MLFVTRRVQSGTRTPVAEPSLDVIKALSIKLHLIP